MAGAYVLLGRARLAAGDLEGAIAAAKLEASANHLNPWEPGDEQLAASNAALQLQGLAHLAARRYEPAARALLAAAAAESTAARTKLASSRELLAALSRLKGLDHDQHALAHQLIQETMPAAGANPAPPAP